MGTFSLSVFEEEFSSREELPGFTLALAGPNDYKTGKESGSSRK
jgi:hypothetical protein